MAGEKSMEVPSFFRCPISMELMENPVTLSTGITYEKEHIERWLFVYHKKTCPATMQTLESLDLTPNNNLRRLISSWLDAAAAAPPPDLAALLSAVESGPFLVSSLRKLQSSMKSEEKKTEIVKLGGVKILGGIVSQILGFDGGDFAHFRACEEALAALHRLPLTDPQSISFLSSQELVEAMVVMLQRGSSEARLHAITLLQKIAEGSRSLLLSDREGEFLKSLLELLSDDATAKASAAAMEVMVNLFRASKKSRLKAVDLGAVPILLELLPEAGRGRSERLLLLLKLVCESPEGRAGFAEHAMGIPAVTKKMLRVSDVASKLGVKILWLVSSFRATERVVEDMVAFGSARKLLVLLQFHGDREIRAKVMEIVKLHGGKWRRHPCFPREFNGIS